MSKEEIVHKDKLGRTLALDDFVAFPQANTLYVGKITKINPKMVKVLQLPRAKTDYNKYPSDVVKLESSDMTWYILKNGS